MASSSSSSTKTRWMYDAFLSFRGGDTRNNFTDHLYMALNRAGFRTFRDSEELRKGEDISPALIGAIQGSRISLVVFSENYAGSSWCLDELLHIMECKRTRGQMVHPIFYHVTPSDVRHQKGSFGNAFEKHEALNRRTQDEISGWRSALRQAANLSGWEVKTDQPEAEFIKRIAHEISTLLNNTYLHVAVYPVGIDSRIEDISNSLCEGVDDDVRMIGILGMGGSGKTSVAKAIYNKVYSSFESKSFIGSVRETAKELNGKITLQERLLSDILKPTKVEVGDADRGIILIKERLGSKKVLVIVDDVDDVDQLTALAIRRDSFGPGSRIIITTRDQHLLELLEVDSIHLTQEMKEKEALELFSWHAFHNPCPDSGFLKLTRRVVTYCGGLPLALEVLGSFLFKGSISHWESTLKKLEKFPDDKIHKILKTSFDALDENQRDIFLHISCFFIRMDKSYVIQILDGCDLFADNGISVLIQRCLVTVSEKNKLMIHDLLRDMGREVVRAESPKDPEKRSRLWRQEDVINVMTEKSGTKKIEGLALNLQRSDKKRFRTIAFRKMKRLKLLQLNYVQLDGDYKYLSKQMAWLCWRGFPEDIIQKEFLNKQNLVSIDLRYSNLVKVWEHPRFLGKLKILNLSHSHYLTQSPDFSNLPNLEYLILKDCVSLPEIDISIGSLQRLVLVNLKDCIMLQDLPESFYELKSIETLVLSGCSGFKNLGEHIGEMISLTTLVVSDTALSEIPESISQLPKLEQLNISNCRQLQLLPKRLPLSLLSLFADGCTVLNEPRFNWESPFLASRTAISRVPSWLGRLKLNFSSLQDLTLRKNHFPEMPRYHFPALPQGFTSLNMESSSVHSLPEFPCFNKCTNVPASGDLPTRSKDLESDHCTALAIFPNSSKASRQSIQQEWLASGDGGICLPADYFPGVFGHVRETDQVFFQIPQIIGCNLKALTVRVVCSLCFSKDISPIRNSIFVTNHTKLICFVVRPAYPTEITSHEVIWQGNLSNNQLNLEGGDFVEVEVVTGSGLRVKKTGVSLVWDPNLIKENMIECEHIPYECLASDADNEARPSHDSSDENRRPSKRLRFDPSVK